MQALSCLSLIVVLHSKCVGGWDNHSSDNLSMQKAERMVGGIIQEPSLQDGRILMEMIPVPEGYLRISSNTGTFARYLQVMPLKPENSPILLYDGRKKRNQDAHVAVVDLSIGTRNLHQCADAIIRLWAEYLYAEEKYGDISFHFTSGDLAEYTKYTAGYRPQIRDNEVTWHQMAAPGNSKELFWKYLEMIFTYAGSYSLEKELTSVSIKEMKIGDVFIQGGFPGHAVIVVDMAIHEITGEKVFLLAQSYMPAQEIQILKNPSSVELSPWYKAGFNGILETPEWTFDSRDLKRF